MNKEKQIEEMTKFVCMGCRYFMQCNDDTMCDGRTLSETIKEDCWTLKYAEELYNKGYRKQSEGEWVETDYKTFEHGFVERRGKAWKCTNCLHASKKFDNHMNFCPNCGARMKGGAE